MTESTASNHSPDHHHHQQKQQAEALRASAQGASYTTIAINVTNNTTTATSTTTTVSVPTTTTTRKEQHDCEEEEIIKQCNQLNSLKYESEIERLKRENEQLKMSVREYENQLKQRDELVHELMKIKSKKNENSAPSVVNHHIHNGDDSNEMVTIVAERIDSSFRLTD